MLTGSIPPTGIPLPFISAGGSSLMVFMAAIGILINISNNSTIEERRKLTLFNFKKTVKITS